MSGCACPGPKPRIATRCGSAMLRWPGAGTRVEDEHRGVLSPVAAHADEVHVGEVPHRGQAVGRRGPDRGVVPEQVHPRAVRPLAPSRGVVPGPLEGHQGVGHVLVDAVAVGRGQPPQDHPAVGAAVERGVGDVGHDGALLPVGLREREVDEVVAGRAQPAVAGEVVAPPQQALRFQHAKEVRQAVAPVRHALRPRAVGGSVLEGEARLLLRDGDEPLGLLRLSPERVADHRQAADLVVEVVREEPVLRGHHGGEDPPLAQEAGADLGALLRGERVVEPVVGEGHAGGERRAPEVLRPVPGVEADEADGATGARPPGTRGRPSGGTSGRGRAASCRGRGRG